MEIRLKIWELIIVVFGLLASGVLIGLILAGDFPTTSGLLSLGLILLPTLTIIFRKRYKN